MKKERLLYLDFIRAIAAVSIVLTHYNARYILFANPPVWRNVVVTGTVSNIYIGSWGVSLFFIISGAALMYTYSEVCELKIFYRKRFESLFPMFWIAYSIAFLYYFYIYRGLPFNAPKTNIIFSVLGMDGYLMENIPTFYILGEWFLGAIILMYILFPLLRKMLKDHPIILISIVGAIYAVIILKYNLPFKENKFLFTRIPEFLFGMYFVEYIKKVDKKQVSVALIVLFLNGVCRPPLNESLQTTYVGIASFIVLVYLSKLMKFKVVKNTCGLLSKYSYAIFLVHHVVIAQIMSKYDYENLSRVYSYILFALCCCVIAVMASILYSLNNKIISYVKDCFAK